MKVRDVMSPDVETIRSTTSAKAAADRMAKNGIGYLPVTERGRLIGIVTDRDIACRVVAEDRDPKTTKVADIMSKGIAYCFDDDELTEAVHLMEENRVRRLPVLDRKEHLVGILSLSDVAKHAPQHLTAEILDAVTRDVPLSVTINPLANILR
ncbi:MAG TPA: CBS domain-containing protein [Stellaceae bacterium]|nr:CBS domain-containing protein [Stellaceae bacterium]